MIQRFHLIFQGRVQGVGFRFKSYIVANDLGLTGTVENLYDGDVEVFIQGPSDMIDLFIYKLDHDRYIRIKKILREEVSVVKGEANFTMLN